MELILLHQKIIDRGLKTAFIILTALYIIVCLDISEIIDMQ